MPFLRALDEHRQLAAGLAVLAPAVERAAQLWIEALGQGAPILLCGNGGSATDAEHLAGELVGRFLKDRHALPAISLGQGIASLTAVANDYGYEEVFARQVDAFARPGGVLVAISTSGNSPSIVRAAERAQGRGLSVIGMTAEGGGRLGEIADVLIAVPTKITARAQEMHILIGHALCEAAESALWPG
ncbi:SIS domain-containing protein [bacterium]|nr:MAG: SIS domain-containing protein [bacterium]